MATLAVAALSARSLVEAAAADGHVVLALDLFGDLDTRRCAQAWWCIGDAAALRICATAFTEALRQAAAMGAEGWIAGSGFEAEPALLAAGAGVLPLLGNPAPVWQRATDARGFFGALASHGLPHPEVAWQRPADPRGWLHKQAGSCGGWGVQGAAEVADPAPGGYFQRHHPGSPVSATFVADGRRAVLLGFNRQRVLARPGAAYAFAGIVGPVPLPARAAAGLQQALAALVAEFGLVGLGSLDALLDGDRIALLEINPRPPASHALYEPDALAAHLDACRHGRLPAAPAAARVVRGQAIVYTRGALQVDAALATWLAARPDSHDLPQPGTRLGAGDPLCSLAAAGDDADGVMARLDAEVERLLTALAERNHCALETLTP
jgi:predicted ATP-grasp superfamily ATP-dependent carboligase